MSEWMMTGLIEWIGPVIIRRCRVRGASPLRGRRKLSINGALHVVD